MDDGAVIIAFVAVIVAVIVVGVPFVLVLEKALLTVCNAVVGVAAGVGIASPETNKLPP